MPYPALLEQLREQDRRRGRPEALRERVLAGVVGYSLLTLCVSFPLLLERCSDNFIKYEVGAPPPDYVRQSYHARPDTFDVEIYIPTAHHHSLH
ncbi:MAG: hypothetical protein ABIA93_00650 [Candidatus Woesearchaeota archaeon]